VSVSWLACTLTLDRWVPTWTAFFTLFWAPSCSTASSCPCGSDRQILEGAEAPFRHACSLISNACFSISPSAALNVILYTYAWYRESIRCAICFWLHRPVWSHNRANPVPTACSTTSTRPAHTNRIQCNCKWNRRPPIKCLQRFH